MAATPAAHGPARIAVPAIADWIATFSADTDAADALLAGPRSGVESSQAEAELLPCDAYSSSKR